MARVTAPSTTTTPLPIRLATDRPTCHHYHRVDEGHLPISGLPLAALVCRSRRFLSSHPCLGLQLSYLAVPYICLQVMATEITMAHLHEPLPQTQMRRLLSTARAGCYKIPQAGFYTLEIPPPFLSYNCCE
jgi:hypothetical protein